MSIGSTLPCLVERRIAPARRRQRRQRGRRPASPRGGKPRPNGRDVLLVEVASEVDVDQWLAKPRGGGRVGELVLGNRLEHADESVVRRVVVRNQPLGRAARALLLHP